MKKAAGINQSGKLDTNSMTLDLDLKSMQSSKSKSSMVEKIK